jgi:hypothetical protein
MAERRIETRLLCADLVNLDWTDKAGQKRRAVANLEDISLLGACVQLDFPMPLGTVVRVKYPQGKLSGTVKYCVFREIGYFTGIEFDAGSRWKLRNYRPQHLLDPRLLKRPD